MGAGIGLSEIVAWLKDQVKAAHAAGVVYGLSGGVDSAVVGGLAVRACGAKALGLIMPCESSPTDEADARLVQETLGLAVQKYELTPAYHQFLTLFRDFTPVEAAKANLKARLRMNTLYFVANQYNYLVLGTSNRSEITVGYYTKWGDSAVDLRPLADLTKHEVRRLAAELGVPEAIIVKPPSAGLWPGQTDEAELGITYEEIDAYITGAVLPPAVHRRIEQLEAKNQHKRVLPPSPCQTNQFTI